MAVTELAALVVYPWGHGVQLGYGTAVVAPGLYAPTAQPTHDSAEGSQPYPARHSASGRPCDGHTRGMYVRTCLQRGKARGLRARASSALRARQAEPAQLARRSSPGVRAGRAHAQLLDALPAAHLYRR